MSGRRWRESEVNRDARGRFAHKARGNRAAEAVKAIARRLAPGDGRSGPRLRWGHKGTKDWWYIPKGGMTYWVERGTEPTWIRGYYYLPTHWGPVVGPGQSKDYYGVHVGSPISWEDDDPEGRHGGVPRDVHLAAKHDTIHGRNVEDPSARGAAFGARRRRTGAETAPKKGVRRVTTTRRK